MMSGTRNDKKRGRVSFFLTCLPCYLFEEAFFRGRPGSRNDDSNPRRFAVFCCQRIVPNGAPRFTDRLNAFNSASVSASFTQSIHFRPRGTGQSSRVILRLRLTRCHKLDQRHASARPTRFARKALRSTYRHSVVKCSSSSTGNDLNRP